MIDHVILTVKDFERSVAFYRQVLKPLGITEFTTEGARMHRFNNGRLGERSHLLLSCEEPYRSDLKPARTSSERSFGCSQAAKCPPLGSLLK